MANTDALKHVLAQIEKARPELDRYAPAGFGWHGRAVAVANTLVPWLVSQAPELKVFTEEVLNSSKLLRDAWASLRTKIDTPTEVQRIDKLLKREDVLLKFVAGDTVSTIVSGHLIDEYPGGLLAGNSKSDYPDLYLKSQDYSKLAARSGDGGEIGAAVRGEHRRPARVPDGLEIKTARGKAQIDCHFAHVGLHLMLTFTETNKVYAVNDVLVAFLRTENYRIAKVNTEATTRKASFTREPFISLLPVAR